MFRLALSAIRITRVADAFIRHGKILVQPQICRLSTNILQSSSINLTSLLLKPLPSQSNNLLQTFQPQSQLQARTVTKFSLNKGKRKSVKAVLKRFKRLHWGGWIRTRCGRHKKMWRKSKALKRRLRQHVLVNATQSWLLDKMVTKFWRKPKYYIDDPYAPYHTREEFTATRKKPIKY